MFDPKKAGEEANDLIKGLNQPNGEAENPSGETDPAIVQDSADAEIVQPTDEVAATDQQAVDTANPANDLADKLDKLSKDLDAANQRWKVLQGMVDKKDEELHNLRVMLAQLADKESTAADTQSPQTPPASQSLVTDEEVREYGADYIDVMSRVARQVFATEFQTRFAQMQERFGKLESSVQSVEQTTTLTAQERFLDALTTKVPDWESLNTDIAFLAWLDGMDKYAGRKKIDLLRDAYKSMDATRTAAFFETYKEEAGLSAQPPAASSADPSPAASPQDKLVKLVSPGKSKSVTPKQEGAGHMWTRADIAKLYDDKMANRISQDEFQKLERDLFKAQQDGRIAA